MKTEVLHFDKLEQDFFGERVREKIHSTIFQGVKICSVIWCVWNDRKQRWGKWHDSYFFYGEKKYYDNESFRTELDKRTCLTIV